MIKKFYNQKGFSRKNFQRWAENLTKGFISGVDYQKIDGDFSFEPTAKVVVVMRLAERYPKDFTNHDIYQALVEANIEIKPSYILEAGHFWPSIVHCVHTIWRSRRKDKLAEVGGNEVDKEYLTTTVDENDNIVLSAPKILLPEADSTMEESTSTIQPKQEADLIMEESTSKILLPEADSIMEESTSTIQPKQEQEDDDDFDIEINKNKKTITLTFDIEIT